LYRYMYSSLLSYDGSFQIRRNRKPFDEHDICLSDGAKYFVPQTEYMAHLLANAAAPETQSAKVSNLP
jgi:hypothetical protein